MEAMMVEIQSHKTKLEALTSGTSSTTPPALVDASDKGDPLNKEKPLEDDPEKVSEVEGDEDTTKKGDTPRGHNSEIPHPTSYVSGRHLQMPHLASCVLCHHLMLLALPIGKITCARTLTLSLLSFGESLSRDLIQLPRT
jgi:hypothetical protein